MAVAVERGVQLVEPGAGVGIVRAEVQLRILLEAGGPRVAGRAQQGEQPGRGLGVGVAAGGEELVGSAWVVSRPPWASRPATTELSTPPDIATTTRVSCGRLAISSEFSIFSLSGWVRGPAGEYRRRFYDFPDRPATFARQLLPQGRCEGDWQADVEKTKPL